MKTNFWLGLCASLMLMSAGTAHAEGGTCPNGYYPIGGQGTMGCAPIPNYGGHQQQAPQPPPEQWADRWGAVVSSYGWALSVITGAASEEAAVQAVMSDCKAKGRKSCRLEQAYRNGCFALVVSPSIYTFIAKPTEQVALREAVRACCEDSSNRENPSNCEVYYSACSPPIRIR